MEKIQSAFLLLKDKITSPLYLSFPGCNGLFIMDNDASDFAVDVVLAHRRDYWSTV